MNIPEEFGKYLLLKKLTEDPLGETFRAGRVGKEGMEQVLLLRVFNGKGVDGEKLWQKASGRAAIQQALKSPNIGSGVDLGRVRSFPWPWPRRTRPGSRTSGSSTASWSRSSS